ncbi:MAG: hypothetical protein ABID09_01500 [Candidatus Omnitrophota bacterium]
MKMVKAIALTALILCNVFYLSCEAGAGNEKKGFDAVPGTLYVGMPKEVLYEIYAGNAETGYRNEGNEEWITFSGTADPLTLDTTTFHLKDGKVTGWETGDEDGKRLKRIREELDKLSSGS